MYKLRSVDVWDTLLRRDCHPECIKLATARHLWLSYGDELLPSYRGQWELYQARLDAERQCAEQARASGCDDEYEITEVISRWLATVFGECVGDQTICSLIAEHELKVEIARCYPDAGIGAFLQNYPSDQTIFLSDFYMNAKMLGRLIEAKGLTSLVPSGIASCDVAMNKRSGRLYEYVHKTYGVDPQHHVHVGDNKWSDVDSARQLGIDAIHYLPDLEHAQRIKREELFSSRDALFSSLINKSRQEARSLLAASDQGEQIDAFMLGVDAAPLFIGFATWIAEQSLSQGLDCVLFLTREGEFFHQIYTAMFPDGVCAGHKLPRSCVLPASRLSTFAASLQAPTFDEISRAWQLINQQALSALFLQLGLDICEFGATLESLGLSPTDVITAPSQSRPLRLLCDDSKFRDALRASISSNKALLREYLRERGVHSDMKVGIVDIGWRGTIQDNIALVEPEIHFHGMYMGLRGYLNQQPVNATKDAYGPNENVDGALNALFEVFAALEMLCTSPNGSVLGYQRRDGVVTPVRDVSQEENLTFHNFTAHFQRGVCFATVCWRPMLDGYSVASNELRGLGLKVWEGLRIGPSQTLVSVFMQTPQHDIFGYGEIFSRNQVPSIRAIFLSSLIGAERQKLMAFVRRLQWSAAIRYTPRLSWLHRQLLFVVFQLASRLKLLRMRVRHMRRRKIQ